jgi:hypothetical protein
VKRPVLFALALIGAFCGAADGSVARKMSESEMTAADVVATGRVIGIGFSHDDLFDPKAVTQFASVLVESVQKGAPSRPLKVLIDSDLETMTCCMTGGRFKMYLKRAFPGMYKSVSGRDGIVKLSGQP